MGAPLLPSLQSGEFRSGRGAAEAASGASGTSGGTDEGLVEDETDTETVFYGSAPPTPDRRWSPGLDAGLPPPSSHQMSQRPTPNTE